MSIKAVRIKSLKVGTVGGDYYVEAVVDSPTIGTQVVHHTCLATGNWEQDFNDLLMTVIREARDLS